MIENTSKQKDLSAAILQLRPEFAVRINLIAKFAQIHNNSREFLNNLRKTTYFATIPKDICKIIQSFIPDLRQSSNILHNNIATRITDQHEKFLDKYHVGGADRKRWKGHVPSLSLVTLQKDFPRLEFVDRQCIYMKIIDDQPIFMQQYTWFPLYLGHNQYVFATLYEHINITTTDYLIPNTSPEYKTIQHAPRGGHPSGNYQTCILPCGLVFKQIDYSDFTCKQSLWDPLTNTTIDVDHTIVRYRYSQKQVLPRANLIFQYIDDFGTIYDLPSDYSRILEFSQFSSRFLLGQIVANDAEFLARY